MLWSAVSTVLVFCAISIASVRPELMLSDSEIESVSETILRFVRFNLAQRVNPHDKNQKDERPVVDLIADEHGREELKAIDRYLSTLINDALSKRPITDDDYQKYILNQGQLFIKLFSTDLSAGYVEKFPKYYFYPNGTGNSTIHVLPEVISTTQNYATVDDFGPALPSFPAIESETTPANVFENVQIWVPEVEDGFKNPGDYRLNHIIPLPVLERFYELFSAVWRGTDLQKQKILLAPFRVLNATSRAAQYIVAGRELNSPNFKGDYEKLKKRFTYEYNFDYDIKKYYFWAMGNLYWGFKRRVESRNSESEFDHGSEVITGHKRYEEAETIFNRLLDFMHRFDWTEKELTHLDRREKQIKLQNIVRNITGDQALFNEMKDLMFHYVYFGLDRDEPYQLEPQQWHKKQKEDPWKLKTLEEYGEVEDPSYETLSEGCKKHLADGMCHVAENIKDVSKKEATYKKVEDCLVRDIVSDQTHLVHYNHVYRKSSPGRKSTTLGEQNSFIRKSQHDNHFNGKCPPEDPLCKTVSWMCKNGVTEEKMELSSDSKDPSKAKVAFKPTELFYSTSFPDWCTGHKFDNPNKITTDSAFKKLMTYRTSSEWTINSTIHEKIYTEYLLDSEDDKVIDFFDYVEEQLKNPVSTSSQLLMGICKESNFVDVMKLPTESDETGVAKPSFYHRHKTAILVGEGITAGALLLAGLIWPPAAVAGIALGGIMYKQT